MLYCFDEEVSAAEFTNPGDNIMFGVGYGECCTGVERNELEPKTSLNIGFHILEKNDGFTGQIIYSGDPDAKLIMKGVIEGVKEIKTNTSVSRIQMYKMVPYRIGLPWVAIILFGVSILLVISKETISERFAGFVDKVSIKLLKWFLIIFALAILIVPTILIWTYGYGELRDEVDKNLINVVPTEIKP